MRHFTAFSNDTLIHILSILLDNGFEAVVITDGDPDKHRIVYANDRFCEMTGYSRDELYGHSPNMLSGERTSPRVISRLKHALHHGHPFIGATTNYRKDGSPYSVQWNIYPVMGEDGKPNHFVSIQKDLTDLRQSLNRLKSSSQAFRLFLNELGGNTGNGAAEINSYSKIAQDALRSNAEVLGQYVKSGKEESDDSDIFFDDEFFDFDDSTGHSASIGATNALSAKTLFATQNLNEQDVRHIEDIAKNLSNMFEVYDIQDMNPEDRREFIGELQEMANTVMHIEEFIDISVALSELSVCLLHHSSQPLDFMITEALKGLTNDLITWVEEVFVNRQAADVHWLDNSIIGSAKQILVFTRLQFEKQA